jgi:hypothetical protein
VKRANLVVVAATLLAVLAWGCGEDATCPNCRYPAYLPQTSPENVLHNLKESWEFREIEPYAALLAPDFRFYFRQDDVPPDLPRDYWNRDEDSTGTGTLFNATTAVDTISVNLGTFTVEDSVRVDQPDVKRIRLTHSMLKVEQRNGMTWMVDDVIEEFYFRKGRSEEGTDPTRWYIFEWHEFPAGWGFKRTSGASDLDESSQLVWTGSWGLFKQLYR